MGLTLSAEREIAEGLSEVFGEKIEYTPIGQDQSGYTLDSSSKDFFRIGDFYSLVESLDFTKELIEEDEKAKSKIYSMDDEKIDDGRRYYDSATNRYFVWDEQCQKFRKVSGSREEMFNRHKKYNIFSRSSLPLVKKLVQEELDSKFSD